MASFKSAFASARKAGKDTFTWNGKKYTTELASEKSSAPEKSKRPAKKPSLMITAESPRAPKASPKPKARADRGTGAVTRSARPAAKPTRTATEAKPMAESPVKAQSAPPKKVTPKKVSDREVNRDRAMKTYKEPARKTGTGKKKVKLTTPKSDGKQRSAPGKANFLSFFKGVGKGRGGLSDKGQGLKQKRGGISDK